MTERNEQVIPATKNDWFVVVVGRRYDDQISATLDYVKPIIGWYAGIDNENFMPIVSSITGTEILDSESGDGFTLGGTEGIVVARRHIRMKTKPNTETPEIKELLQQVEEILGSKRV